METIFAPATGAGAVAIVRVSGPSASAACLALAGRLPPPRMATLARLRDGAGETIDRGLVLWFPGPASVTGEDLVEFQIHGGRAVTATLCESLAAIEGLRPAEAGEFTRRGFLNGRFDLTAAEGVGDLVAAETAAQRRQALRQMEGGLATLYDGWRESLFGALAHAEAAIDFVEEGLPADLEAAVAARVAAVADAIERHVGDARRGERVREGLRIAIVGPPNAGKSSLLNRLVQREAAIVAETAGTTRDVVEARLDLAGYAVTIADTAGLRETTEAVEAEGVRRARRAGEAADLVLVVVEAGEARESLDLIREVLDARALIVVNKCDLHPFPVLDRGLPAVVLSCRTGDGLDRLTEELAARVAVLADVGAAPAPTRERHRAGLAAALAALWRFPGCAAPELAAEELRRAVLEIGRVTGRVEVEEVLDRIFGDFCIGK